MTGFAAVATLTIRGALTDATIEAGVTGFGLVIEASVVSATQADLDRTYYFPKPDDGDQHTVSW